MSRSSLCKRFAADQGGVVAVILAFLLVPLLMAVGGRSITAAPPMPGLTCNPPWMRRR